MYKIDNSFVGANCKIISLEEDKAIIDVELRDTVTDWFFWCFKVVGAGGKTITFQFEGKDRVGYYGPAVSYDNFNWFWQYDDPKHEGNCFTYTFKENEDVVYFAHDMVYRQDALDKFAKENDIQLKTLCKSEKGRDIPYIEMGDGEQAIILTARHHACESTGNFVLEGVLESLKNTLAKKYKIFCVPFVDYDGVVDGDQGKNRNNHDHNRDYTEDQPSIYSSVAKIREFADNHKIKYAFDFHAPWHYWGVNDTVFFPFNCHATLDRSKKFSLLFEKHTQKEGALPHFAKDDVLPDDSWNQSSSKTFGRYMSRKNAELSFTTETTYYIASGVQFTPERAKETGRRFVSALIEYDNQL